MFPGFEHLYWFTGPFAGAPFLAEMPFSIETLLAGLRGESSVALSATARWKAGRSEPADVVWVASYCSVLVSNRVVNLFKDNHFTGWSAAQCRLRDKLQNSHTYNYLSIIGRCGAIDHTKSREFQKAYPGGVFPAWRGIYFDSDTWDGSDLFMPSDESAWIIVTSRVKEALERARMKAFTFEALDQIERAAV